MGKLLFVKCIWAMEGFYLCYVGQDVLRELIGIAFFLINEEDNIFLCSLTLFLSHIMEAEHL